MKCLPNSTSGIQNVLDGPTVQEPRPRQRCGPYMHPFRSVIGTYHPQPSFLCVTMYVHVHMYGGPARFPSRDTIPSETERMRRTTNPLCLIAWICPSVPKFPHTFPSSKALTCRVCHLYTSRPVCYRRSRSQLALALRPTMISGATSIRHHNEAHIYGNPQQALICVKAHNTHHSTIFGKGNRVRCDVHPKSALVIYTSMVDPTRRHKLKQTTHSSSSKSRYTSVHPLHSTP